MLKIDKIMTNVLQIRMIVIYSYNNNLYEDNTIIYIYIYALHKLAYVRYNSIYVYTYNLHLYIYIYSYLYIYIYMFKSHIVR